MPRPNAKHGPPSHRVYGPGKRHFELIASVSRSSGLERDGDALRDPRTQEEYRQFIQGKVDEYWKLFPYGRPPRDVKRRDEVQGNILIQFRKLREGLLSTKRKDAFALEAYETSLHLSALFFAPAQTSSVIPQLLPAMYAPLTPPPASALPAVLVSLLHYLATAYPSQSRFLEHLAALPHTLLPRTSPAWRWVWDVARALRQRDFARLEDLTRHAAFAHLVPGPDAPAPPGTHGPANLPLAALCVLVESLRSKARETVWSVLRAAYRELVCTPGAGGAASPTTAWLYRSLVLRPVSVTQEEEDEAKAVDVWLESKARTGDVRPKEGVEGRWIVCKPKT